MSLICTGLGTGGEISKMFHKIQDEVNNNNTNTLNQAEDVFFNKIDSMINYPWYIKIFKSEIIKQIKNIINSLALNTNSNRNNSEFLTKPITKELIKSFILQTNSEISKMSNLKNFSPTSLIFGHTHIPTLNNNYDINKNLLPGIKIYNTGGWLRDSKGTVILIKDDSIAGLTV